MGVFALGGGYVAFRARETLTPFPLVSPEHGSVELVGRELFTKVLAPFELATALLIVAVIGAIAVARAHVDPKAKTKPERLAPQKLFHGPLHPRDAGHPLVKERV